jgi:hypothetical protein
MASLGTKRGSVDVNALIVNDCFGREERIRTSDSWSRTNNRCTNLLSRLGLFCVQYPRLHGIGEGMAPSWTQVLTSMPSSIVWSSIVYLQASHSCRSGS